MSHFYQPDDDTWEGRMGSYIEEAEKQIAALRAALAASEERGAKLRRFAQDCESLWLNGGVDATSLLLMLRAHELLDACGQPTALLSAPQTGEGER